MEQQSSSWGQYLPACRASWVCLGSRRQVQRAHFIPLVAGTTYLSSAQNPVSAESSSTPRIRRVFFRHFTVATYKDAISRFWVFIPSCPTPFSWSIGSTYVGSTPPPGCSSMREQTVSFDQAGEIRVQRDTRNSPSPACVGSFNHPLPTKLPQRPLEASLNQLGTSSFSPTGGQVE